MNKKERRNWLLVWLTAPVMVGLLAWAVLSGIKWLWAMAGDSWPAQAAIAIAIITAILIPMAWIAEITGEE